MEDLDEILSDCTIEYHKGIDILTPAITPEFIVMMGDNIIRESIDKTQLYKCYIHHSKTPEGINLTRIVKVEIYTKTNK